MSQIVDEMIREHIAETQARMIIRAVEKGMSIDEVAKLMGFTKAQISTVLTGNYGAIMMSQEEYAAYEKDKEQKQIDSSISLRQVSEMWDKYRDEKGITGDPSLISKEYASDFFGYLEREWERLLSE